MLVTSNKLYLVDVHTGASRDIPLDISGYEISALAKIDSTNAVFGTESGELLLIDTIAWSITKASALKHSRNATITDVVKYKDQLWIGSDNGLHITDLSLIPVHSFDRRNSKLASDHITTLFLLEDQLLVGTYNGLDQTSPAPFELRNSENTNVYNDVMAIEEDADGSIWVGTFDGVFKYDRDTQKHSRFMSRSDEPLPDQRAMSIEAIGKYLWIGFWKNGIALVDIKSNNVLPIVHPKLSEVSVTNIFSQSEQTTWIATYNHGVFRLDGKTVHRYLELSGRPVIAFTLSPMGRLYALSEKTVFLYDSALDKFVEQTISYPEGLQEVALLTLRITDEYAFYLGTKDHGAFQLQKEKLGEFSFSAKVFGPDSNLSSSSVYSILSDKDRNFWLSTNTGVVQFNKNGKFISRFDRSNGLQGNDFNFGAYLKSSDGSIFFGGPNGYNKFSPSEIQTRAVAPRITVPLVEVGGIERSFYTNVKNSSDFRLGYRSQNISISLGVMDFTNPEQNRYTHILEGQDPTWVDDGTNNTITYTNLEPGDYVFRAKGANSAGIWSTDNVSLRIQVLPPWWRTWWAYGLYVVSFLIAVWIAMRLYRAHLLKEEAVRNAIEMQDAADNAHDQLQDSHEFQDDLVRAVHQHNLATLDLISSYLKPTGRTEVTTSKVLGHIKAMELLENCYYFQNSMLMADIHKYVDSLIPHLLQTTSADPTTITTINLTTSELLPAQAASPAAVILYELLENAFLHAFPEESIANFIEVRGELIHSNESESTLVLSVSDDGTKDNGFGVSGASEGTGLAVVSSLARSTGGDVAISQEEGSMVQVSLLLPY